MGIFRIIAVATLISALGAGLAYARHHNKPAERGAWVVRDGIMHLISDQRAILEDMAEGKREADVAEFIRAANGLAVLLQMVPSAFEKKVLYEESRAKPEIWQNWDDFVATAISNSMAAAEIARTAELQGIDAAIPKLEAIDCGGCHDPYRQE